MKPFTTFISLPPGLPPSSLVSDLFHLIFETHRWFRPALFGRAVLNKKLDPEHIDFDALVAYYEHHQNITVTGRTDRDYIFLYPAKSDSPPYIGCLTWGTAAKETQKPAWRDAHLRGVAEVMKLLRSPLAQAGLAEDLRSKTDRWVPHPDGLGDVMTHTVSDYSQGLPGLMWRNFFGPPFVHMFGERLASLPSEFKQELGEGLVLLQPYALPSEAGTPGAIARERELISVLGPECFYDHEHHLKPTRVPALPHL